MPVSHAEPEYSGLLEQKGWYMIRSLKDQGLALLLHKYLVKN